MITLLYSLLLFLTGIAGGFVGSFTGLGGAVVITPILSILLGVPLEYATGVSLVSTIATSGGSTISFIKDRITNIRIGLSLTTATTTGAIIGALSAVLIYSHNLAYLIFVIFGAVLLLSLYPVLRRRKSYKKVKADASTRIFGLDGKYRDAASRKTVKYTGIRWWVGEAVMLLAGIVSGLLGIGSGVLKVIGMDSGMRLPIKVSTATSEFMIGITAVTGSAIYWAFGYVKPLTTAPVILGALTGAFAGSRVMERERSRVIMAAFMVVLTVVAVEMILRGLGIA